jgi:hypothetical protein
MFLIFFFTFIFLNVFGADPEPGSLNFSFDDFTVTNTAPSESENIKTENTKEVKQKRGFLGFGGKEGRQTENKSSIDDFFDKGIQTLQDLKKIGQESIDELTKKNKPTKKKKVVDLAKSFPDPFFYDAIYTKDTKFIAYAYLYNDKTNKDNDHIPKLKTYNAIKELFDIAKSEKGHDKFYELFKASKQDKTFNINQTDAFGNTLLLTALRNGNLEIFLFLLSQNANPNICNNNNICPIQLAVYSNNIDATKALCVKGVNIRVRDNNGILVMQYAIYQRQIKIVQILLERYMQYPVNRSERLELVDFTYNSGLENLAKEMEKRFML